MAKKTKDFKGRDFDVQFAKHNTLIKDVVDRITFSEIETKEKLFLTLINRGDDPIYFLVRQPREPRAEFLDPDVEGDDTYIVEPHSTVVFTGPLGSPVEARLVSAETTAYSAILRTLAVQRLT
jgi:hypothetical protein